MCTCIPSPNSSILVSNMFTILSKGFIFPPAVERSFLFLVLATSIFSVNNDNNNNNNDLIYRALWTNPDYKVLNKAAVQMNESKKSSESNRIVEKDSSKKIKNSSIVRIGSLRKVCLTKGFKRKHPLTHFCMGLSLRRRDPCHSPGRGRRRSRRWRSGWPTWPCGWLPAPTGSASSPADPPWRSPDTHME